MNVRQVLRKRLGQNTLLGEISDREFPALLTETSTQIRIIGESLYALDKTVQIAGRNHATRRAYDLFDL